jgi:hypothetical protein
MYFMVAIAAARSRRPGRRRRDPARKTPAPIALRIENRSATGGRGGLAITAARPDAGAAAVAARVSDRADQGWAQRQESAR